VYMKSATSELSDEDDPQGFEAGSEGED
jgi:hypothetical protein